MNADLLPILPTEEEANINLFPHEEANFVSPEPGFFMEVDDFFVEEEEDNHVILPSEEDANVDFFPHEDEDTDIILPSEEDANFYSFPQEEDTDEDAYRFRCNEDNFARYMIYDDIFRTYGEMYFFNDENVWQGVFGFRPHFAYSNRKLINEQLHKRLFRSQIAEELIATVMHPCRIQNKMNPFDDIEEFFTATGC
ncbi:hypothetical protein PR003_g12691 [Phytophthora rubi]|uniref:Uncharacterized protein n=1 Tax=Phytophthora rubi TaxID=129364 RepID=A0A6A4FHK4_9STRA|nr:hypothetical protein PR003_g12691 [Phytophthora rubi]